MYVTYAVLRLFSAVVACMPRRAVASLGAQLGWIAGSLLRIRRTLVEHAMQRAGVVDPPRTARRMYRELGSGLVELFWLAGARSSKMHAVIAAVSVDDDAVRALDDAIAKGPVVLFASHTGNWEIAAAAAARVLEARGKKLFVVAKEMHDRGVDAFLSRLRGSMNVRIIHPSGAMTAARDVLRKGDVVVVPVDQVPTRASHGMALSFLGDVALVDRAPATLAWRSRATVLVVAAMRIGDVHRVCVLGKIAAPERRGEGSARSWIDRATSRATLMLDAFVRGTPHAWLWLHRRWRAPRASAGAAVTSARSACSGSGRATRRLGPRAA